MYHGVRQVPSMGLNMTMDWKEQGNTIPASVYRYEDDFPALFDIKWMKADFFWWIQIWKRRGCKNMETVQMLE